MFCHREEKADQKLQERSEVTIDKYVVVEGQADSVKRKHTTPYENVQLEKCTSTLKATASADQEATSADCTKNEGGHHPIDKETTIYEILH